MSYTTVAVTPGTGANINVDRIGGNDFQRFKLATGAEGAAIDVSSANPLPVSISNVNAYHKSLLDGDNAVLILGTPCFLKGGWCMSRRGTPFYLKFHNVASPPTAGTGVVLAVGCQAGQWTPFTIPQGGMAFSVGLGLTVVTGIADANTSPVVAEDGVLALFYAGG